MALDLPDSVREAIAVWRDNAVAGRPDLRSVAPEALHVTLCFLGWRPEKEVPLVAQVVSDACSGLAVPRLAALGLEPVPPRRPRLFALDLDDRRGRAARVQAAMSDALAAGRFHEPEARPFWPHVTLARVKRGERAGPLEASAPPSEPFDAPEVTLYRSTLRPQGAVYEPLRRAVLGE